MPGRAGAALISAEFGERARDGSSRPGSVAPVGLEDEPRLQRIDLRPGMNMRTAQSSICS
jgi:hypothetical protein